MAGGASDRVLIDWMESLRYSAVPASPATNPCESSGLVPSEAVSPTGDAPVSSESSAVAAVVPAVAVVGASVVETVEPEDCRA